MAPIMFKIGKQIRQRRKDLRWTQEKLGEVAEVPRSKISEIERGVIAEIGFRKILRVFSALGLTFQLVRIDSTPTLDELRARRRKRYPSEPHKW